MFVLEPGTDIAEASSSRPTYIADDHGCHDRVQHQRGQAGHPVEGPAALKYGVSVTDACISLEQTIPLLDQLREGVQKRREAVKRKSQGE